MPDSDHAAAVSSEATPSSSQESASHRERVIREELERRIALFDQLEDAKFGRFGAADWALCTAVFFVLPILVAWWVL